jgi:putative DNA primase/helicase
MASASQARESRNFCDSGDTFDCSPLVHLTFSNSNLYTERMMNATGLSILSAADLLAADLAPRDELLGSLLASDTAALVWGPAGIGKSFFALSIAWAVASGGSFLGWQSPRPHRVLYVDGEMGATSLRERLALFGPPPAGLALSAHDLGGGPILDLTETLGLKRLMAAWDDPELVVLDTLGSLAGLRSGDPERWDRLQRFLMHQRKHRRAVLLVHHANKAGAMRGTTRREDALDLVMALRHPAQGTTTGKGTAGNARFEIHFEKVRRRGAVPLAPMLAALETGTGSVDWRWGRSDGGRFERAVALFRQGLGARAAAAALGVSRTTLFRLKAEARAKGLLRPERNLT